MKRNTLLLAFALFVCNAIFAQQVGTYYPARTGGFWSIGLNAGTAYQSSDICAKSGGWGLGLTVAKNAFYRPGAVFSFDWRGRLLYDESYGDDTKRSYGIKYNTAANGTNYFGLNYTKSPGYIYANYRTRMLELGFEGVLTFNRLRERTGVVASIFGGVGVDWYSVYTDQSTYGLKYDYKAIDSTLSTSGIRALLNATRDGGYETAADGNSSGLGSFRIMPSLGFELGYQFAPRFYAGISHKTTFSRTNTLDGYQWDNTNNVTAGNDWAHYTSLQLVWELGNRERKREDPPQVTITVPNVSPYTSEKPFTLVAADISNVRQKSQVKLIVNGRARDFNFNNPKFYQDIELQNGRNTIEVMAENSAGKDSKTVIIFYNPSVGQSNNPPVLNSNSPEVRINYPNETPARTSEYTYNVFATTKYVYRKEDVSLTVNGQYVDFNYKNNEVTSSISLKNGNNDVRVDVRNNIGATYDAAVIIVEKTNTPNNTTPTIPSRTPATPPTVQVTSPENNSKSVEKTVRVTAMTTNVNKATDVSVSVNGSRQNDVYYDSRSGQVTFNAPLTLASNAIVVSVQNADGKAKDQITVTYLAPLEHKLVRPKVNILTPSQGSVFNNRFCSLTAKVQYVGSKTDITVLLNGNPITDFTFSGSKQVNCDISLNEGNNTILVRGTNMVGTDEESIVVRYEREMRPPSVQITSPTSDITTELSNYAVRATLKNVGSRNDIRMTINDVATSSFNFNGSTLDSYVKLNEGNNRIVISVKTNDGSAQDQVSIRYEVPRPVVLPPNVAFTKPTSAGTTTQSATYAFAARVDNINNKGQITVTVNGRNVTNFGLVNGEVRVTANLQSGENTCTVSVRNDSGNASDNTTVIREVIANTEPQTPTTGGGKVITRPNTEPETPTNGGNTGPRRPRTGTEETPTGVDAPNTPSAPTTGPGNFKLRKAPTLSDIYTAVPVSDPTKPVSDICTISATTTGITTAEQITLTVNGSTVSNYSFSNGQLKYEFKLQSGKNTINVKVENRFGNVEKSAEVSF